ncbi:Choline phosphatase [Rhodovastum atsumiense]|uniref:VTT domain-containing protein n=1 Tax=Rhodovastum atsumiense TaxID=504468 RepID=UPI001EF05D8C|nr:VTT domain-containing protein [Rhodovastum atsumiense]CAH2599326.1 Choline phosphatase [Rhodovastum atsumiense]
MLVDAAAYYAALRAALRAARHSIVIIGWDIDSRTRLVGPAGRAEDGLPETLGAFLAGLAAARPELSIRLLLWDFAMLYTLERETMPALALHWRTPPQVELCLDDTAPPGASHHQKLVVIDDALAFCGGLDLTIRRWDTPAHAPWNPHRVDPAGRPYNPFHDIQMMVDGPAAAALADLARERWAQAACETLPPVVAPEAQGRLWPVCVAAQFEHVTLGIARTGPAHRDRPGIREVQALFADMVAVAERAIYVENQFLTSGRFAQALLQRLRECPALQVLIVAPRTHHTWLEHRTMLAGRIRFMRMLRQGGMHEDRVRLVHPQVQGRGGTAEVMVHAKLMVVDDRLLRVGSANLNNRSMGTDTECDLVIEACGDAGRAAVIGVRNRLLAEHCGSTEAAVAAAIVRAGSLFGGLDAINRDRARCLRPIEDGELDPAETFPAIEAVADPGRPIASSDLLADITAEPPGSHRPWLRAVLLLLATGLLLAAWRFTPLRDLLQPDSVRDLLLRADGAWGAGLALIAFLLLGFLFFPLNVLILGTAAAFGAWPGLAYAAAGGLVSAAATYIAGRRLGPSLLRGVLGPRINRVIRRIDSNGVVAVTMVRLLPVAPFTLVNLAAGAIRVPFIDYMLGTALGLLPGILLMSLLGDRLTRIVTDPGAGDIGIFLLLLGTWGGLSWGLQRLLGRLRRKV